MFTPFSVYQTVDDIVPLLDDDANLVLPLCENIIFLMKKVLDPYKEECVPFTRNNATVVGMFAKIQEMAKESLAAYKANNNTIAPLFYRIEYEAYIKMRYLISHGESAQLAYRLASYKARYKAYQQYIKNPNAVAKVMADKFLADLDDEGFLLSDIANNEVKAFDGKNVRQLMAEIGEEKIYDSVYGISSDIIHTDWGETRQFYLFGDKERMVYRFEPIKLHYRVAIGYAQLNIQAAELYFDWLDKNGLKEAKVLSELLEEFNRVLKLICQHILNTYSASPDTYMRN